jgi:aspartyl-tRNA(Asn)/glutamyl-tRNA(Gln) amidotransferase subunit C
MIDAALVQKVAGLASLELSEAEATYAVKNLARILDFVAELGGLPEPAPSALDEGKGGLSQLERDDQVQPSLEPETAMANAPAREGTAFQVPRIID